MDLYTLYCCEGFSSLSVAMLGTDMHFKDLQPKRDLRQKVLVETALHPYLTIKI